MNVNALRDWDARVGEYFADLQIGLESLNTAPQSDDERQEIFALKRDIVLALVQMVTTDRNLELTVHFNLDILRILQEPANKQGGGTNSGGGISVVQIQSGGIYTRIPDMYPVGQIRWRL